jgi:large subunit ribosomal protein L14e
MVVFEVGRVCIKNVGRESGKYCVVLNKENQSFVLVTGPKLLTGVKRRRCNVNHLQPTEHKIDVKENAADEDVINAFDVAGLTNKLDLKKPSIAQIKSEKQKEEKKVEKKPKKSKKKASKKKK